MPPNQTSLYPLCHRSRGVPADCRLVTVVDIAAGINLGDILAQMRFTRISSDLKSMPVEISYPTGASSSSLSRRKQRRKGIHPETFPELSHGARDFRPSVDFVSFRFAIGLAVLCIFRFRYCFKLFRARHRRNYAEFRTMPSKPLKAASQKDFLFKYSA